MTTATAQLKVIAEPGSHAVTTERVIDAPRDLVFRCFTEREVDAPRDLVFRCFTEKDLFAQWMGPRKYDIRIDEFDLRHGGRWSFTNIDRETGAEYAFRGTFHGEPSPDRWAQTFEFLGAPGHVSLDTLELVDLGGNRTLIRSISLHQSVEARDAMIDHGMAEGMADGYLRLDDLVKTLQA